jgi:intracellular sulfur oxidation DsrE/DsrF family protein
MRSQRKGREKPRTDEENIHKQLSIIERGGSKMGANQRKIVVVLLSALFMVLSGLSSVSAEEYKAMKGVKSANVMFDMRDANVQTAIIHLNLIHDTYNELAAMKKKPVFVVVFMAGSVKLISTDHRGFKAEEENSLKEIASIISKMKKTGIRVEACLFAAKVFGVEPSTILPEIERVGNGWISEIGYQARGYSLVPVY